MCPMIGIMLTFISAFARRLGPAANIYDAVTDKPWDSWTDSSWYRSVIALRWRSASDGFWPS